MICKIHQTDFKPILSVWTNIKQTKWYSYLPFDYPKYNFSSLRFQRYTERKMVNFLKCGQEWMCVWRRQMLMSSLFHQKPEWKENQSNSIWLLIRKEYLLQHHWKRKDKSRSDSSKSRSPKFSKFSTIVFRK